jgi:23S rRNA (cytosine1962-C5)-methyltransferase
MNTNYRLLDTGGMKKLEQFGGTRIIRPAKQAVWKPAWDSSEWKKAAAVYDEEWTGEMPDMNIYFDDVVLSAGMLETGQVGLFPEQMENWAWIKNVIGDKKMNIINGFAYTGGSTLFASTGNTCVTHLDASRPSISKAKKNAELSGRSSNVIRYINDDVMTFLEKEIQRGVSYGGFIFDPPAFGRGGKGKVWKLTKDLPILVGIIAELSGGNPDFVLLSAHDPDMNADSLLSLLKIFKKGEFCSGDLVIPAESGQHLKNGYFARYSRS